MSKITIRPSISNFFNRLLFFIGWLLSPFTFWNDAFINIPLSYLLANIFVKIWLVDFLLTVLVFYWLTNGLGILMMYFSGKSLLAGKRGAAREILSLAATLVVYSIVLILLNKAGILKPI